MLAGPLSFRLRAASSRKETSSCQCSAFSMVTHGFRTMASTHLNEHGFNWDWVERQLAHVEGNKVRAAYNAAEYLSERTKMMQWYADYLDSLTEDAL